MNAGLASTLNKLHISRYEAVVKRWQESRELTREAPKQCIAYIPLVTTHSVVTAPEDAQHGNQEGGQGARPIT